VERNSNGMSYKSYLLFTFIVFMMIGLLISYSYGEEEKKVNWGFSILGGTGDATHGSPDFNVLGFLPRIDLPLHRNWDLEFEGNSSYYKICKEHDLYFLGANSNIVFKPFQWSWGSLFLLGGGGIGYDSAGKRVQEIGDQHFGGILQGGGGIYYKLGKGLALRLEYRFSHISEPFKRDRGLNSDNVLLGISF
jgi:hypothetical protein